MLFWKRWHLNCRLLQIIDGALCAKIVHKIVPCHTFLFMVRFRRKLLIKNLIFSLLAAFFLSVENLHKKFGSRSGRTEHWS